LWDGIVMKMQAATWDLQANFLEALGGMLEGLGPVANNIIRAFVGPYEAVVAAWGALPAAFKRFGALAINGLIDAIEGGVTAILAPLNAILEGVNMDPITPDLSGWRAIVPEAKGIGSAISGALSGVAGTDYVGEGGLITNQVKDMASELRGASDMARDMGDAFVENATRPLESFDALTEKAKEASAAVKGALGGETKDKDGGSGGGGGAAGEADLGAFEALRERLQTERDIVDEWRQETIEATNAAREQELISTQEHKNYMLEIERLYQEQLGELRRQRMDEDLSNYQSFFGSMASALQSGGSKMLKISKAFALAEAAVSIWRGAAKALELPFPANLAAWGQVIATGAKALSGINSVSAGSAGGAGGGASGGGSRQAAPEPAQARRSVRIEVEGEGMFADMLRGSIDEIADAVFDNSRDGGTPIVVGRG